MNRRRASQPSSQAAECTLTGAGIIAALKSARVRFVVAVPDIVTSDGLLWPISRDSSFRLIRVCKEDEGVSICAAMSYNGTRCLLLMQQTGLMDSLNAIRAIGIDYSLPIVMVVGMQGKEPGLPPRESSNYGVRIVPPVLDAMEIEHTCIDTEQDIPALAAGIERAYSGSRPQVFLLGREPVSP